ncbi:MAG: sulfotransferase domain-containing protein [Aestuariivirga sp.]|nr:sulfotransferase domain-containing protein [Aestuariivirga sp.]
MRVPNILKLIISRRARNKLIERLFVNPRLIKTSDYILVSFPKSGRTWVRAMLTRLYHVRFGTPDNLLIRLDNLHKLDGRIPVIFFTHDGDKLASVKDLIPDKSAYNGKNIVVLVRHPGDVIASLYYHQKHRRAHRRDNITKDLDVFSFATRPGQGIHTAIAFINHWMAFAKDNPYVLMVRYEDLLKEPVVWLKRITDHFGGNFTNEELQDAVDFGKFENLKKLEKERYFADTHLQASDNADPQSFKVRSGKSGGYKQQFTDAQVKEIDEMIRHSMDPTLGY